MRKRTLDSGVVRFDYFDENGDLSGYVQYDNPLPQLETTYFGAFQSETQYRGVWELGLDEAVSAGLHDWYLIYSYQGSDPGESSLQFDTDDFRRIVETRVNGVLEERVIWDISDGLGRPDIHDWEVIRETFDASGEMTG